MTSTGTVANPYRTQMEYTQDVSPSFLAPRFEYSPLVRNDSSLIAPANVISQASNPQPRTIRLKRPHTKSRRGCFNCKSRRIKCPETKQACANCIRRHLDCVYPADREWALSTQTNSQAQSQSQSPKLTDSQRISTTPFTGDDLRFWHTFLVDARPYLPFGDEGSWLSEIPAMAHDCPHLLHAILSLGASHCALITPTGSQYHSVAIAHRGKALQSLSATLAKGDACSVLEMDAALATCYTLTFQAHHMSDGIIDFAVMVRGCGLVTDWYFQQRRESKVFSNLQSHEDAMTLITSWLPWELQAIHDPETIAACISSLERLRPLLESPAHYAFYDSLVLAYQSLLVSYRHAFTQLTMIYASWARWDNIEFLTFIAPGNYISRALFMHYVTIDSFMRPVYMELTRGRNIGSKGGHFVIYRFAEALYTGLPRRMQELVADQLRYLALDLIPEVLYEKEAFPRWHCEAEGFAKWLRRRFPGEGMELS
ncbi:hypothetical protein BJX99DRAFT_264290 [Aspergillus californicus]